METPSSFELWRTSFSLLACFACLTCSGKGATSDDSVLERNHHPSRDGLYIQPTFTRTAVANLAMETTFNATFAGTGSIAAFSAKAPYESLRPVGLWVTTPLTVWHDVGATFHV